MRECFYALLFLTYINSAQAEVPTFRFLPYQSAYSIPPEAGTGAYTAPNERYPVNAFDLFENALTGALISVGTERGLITAAMYTNVTHVVQIDRDPKAIFYNQMNLALLRVANSRKDYLNLRLTAPFGEWVKAVEKNVDPRDAAVMQNPVNFLWWQDNVRKNRAFNLFHKAPTRRNLFFKSIPAFEGGHYLYEDHAFRRISNLAKSGRIAVIELELQDTERFVSLVDWLEANQIPVSVIDISNTWWTGYAGNDAILDLTMRLASRANQDLRLIYSSWVTPELSDRSWAYGGVEMSSLQTEQKRERFALYFRNIEVRMRTIGIDTYEINSINAFLKSAWKRYVGCDAALNRTTIFRRF